jgi:hypothetical protein
VGKGLGLGWADRRIILWQSPARPRGAVTVLLGRVELQNPLLARALAEVIDSNPSQQLFIIISSHRCRRGVVMGANPRCG